MGKFSADVKSKYVEVDGKTFLVQQYTWGEGSSAFVEYVVYEPVVTYYKNPDKAGHSTHYNHDGKAWGDYTTFFPELQFEHLLPGTKERSDAVHAYFLEREEEARKIVTKAFDIYVPMTDIRLK